MWWEEKYIAFITIKLFQKNYWNIKNSVTAIYKVLKIYKVHSRAFLSDHLWTVISGSEISFEKKSNAFIHRTKSFHKIFRKENITIISRFSLEEILTVKSSYTKIRENNWLFFFCKIMVRLIHTIRNIL